MIIKKLKNKKGPARTCFRGGFALLFSVLISSLLLTIGLSIFNIALKELAISTASRQSIHAFYAADSGREYAKYLDTKVGIAGLFNVTIGSMTQVGSTTFPSGGLGYILVDGVDGDGPNYYVNIKKVWHDDSYSQVDTTITSYGHDTVSGDRVERAIRQDY
jgi:hypothetical protein